MVNTESILQPAMVNIESTAYQYHDKYLNYSLQW